jgi:ferrochelatase
MKRAVVLLGLGGPLGKADIAPFLFNFFMDKNIVPLPLPLRFLLAKWISLTRSRGAADRVYARLSYKSPLLDNTRAQAVALEQALGAGWKTFVSMRYWTPMADETARAVMDYAPDEIVLLPMYPQYSTTTTGSSFQDWARAARRAGLRAPVREIRGYAVDEGFIAASAENIRAVMRDGARVLFSAHGLPERVIAAGDPYQKECEATAAAIAARLNLEDWQLCYQSRIGRLKWIGPSTEEALEKAARDGKGVVIYPLAFVSEHAETLVEIDMDYRKKAEKMGIGFFARAQTAGTRPAFIAGLAALARG